MSEEKNLLGIFRDEPAQWGLRGDPYLWNEMKDVLGAHPCPGTEEQFTMLFEQTYTQLTGTPFANQDPVFVKRYSHGGMSGGYVSPQFWVEKALPLLLARYRELK